MITLQVLLLMGSKVPSKCLLLAVSLSGWHFCWQNEQLEASLNGSHSLSFPSLLSLWWLPQSGVGAQGLTLRKDR